MNRLVLNSRAKRCYAIAIALFLSGTFLCLSDHTRVGFALAFAGISFALGVAGVNGHLTTRPNSDLEEEKK